MDQSLWPGQNAVRRLDRNRLVFKRLHSLVVEVQFSRFQPAFFGHGPQERLRLGVTVGPVMAGAVAIFSAVQLIESLEELVRRASVGTRSNLSRCNSIDANVRRMISVGNSIDISTRWISVGWISVGTRSRHSRCNNDISIRRIGVRWISSGTRSRYWCRRSTLTISSSA